MSKYLAWSVNGIMPKLTCRLVGKDLFLDLWNIMNFLGVLAKENSKPKDQPNLDLIETQL